MPGPLLHSPADVIRHLLVAIGQGSHPTETGAGNGPWPVYESKEPSRPDEVLTVQDAAGVPQGRTMFDGEVQGRDGFQVRVRAADKVAAFAKANAVAEALAKGVY
jgi:hypothetical protein